MVFFCIISSLLMAATVPVATFSQDDPPPIIIDIGEEPGDPNGNRSPIFVPISCCYYPSLSVVAACFQYSLGTVSVEVENLYSGSVLSQNIDGTAGVHMIPVSSSAGPYAITFTLSDGTEYSGTYIVE